MESVGNINTKGFDVPINRKENTSTSDNGRVRVVTSTLSLTREEAEVLELGSSTTLDVDRAGNKRKYIAERSLSPKDEVARKVYILVEKNEITSADSSDEDTVFESDSDDSDEYGIQEIDRRQLMSLRQACENRELVNSSCGDIGLPPLHAAIKYQKSDLVVAAIDNGAILNLRSSEGYFPLHYLSETGDRDILGILRDKFPDMDMNIRTQKGDTPLVISIARGHDYFSTSMIDSGADINLLDAKGNNLLFFALCYRENNMSSEDGLSEFIIRLIKNMSIESLASRPKKDGRTIMHIAAEKNDFDVMERLIDRGVNIDIRAADHITPLREAMEADSWHAAGLLIEAGAVDINEPLHDGSLPLKAAVEAGAWYAAGELIKRDADGINELLEDGKTVFMQAMSDGECDFTEDIVESGKVDLGKIFGNGKTHRQLVWDAFEELSDELEEGSFTPQDVCNVLRSDKLF